MKKSRLIPIAICLFFACKSKPGSTVVDSTSKTSLNVTGSNKLIEKFKPFFQGVWVISGYVNELVKTRSPYSSSNKFGIVSEMIIEMDKVKNDSLDVGYSLRNHEGGDFTIYFKQGLKPNLLKTNLTFFLSKSSFYELGYKVNGTDTIVVLYHINKHNIIIDSTQYTKVLNKPINNGNAADGIDYITNKTLYEGKYLLTDIGGGKTTVSFTSKGEVFGFLNFSKYIVNTDFSFGSDNNIDIVMFDWATSAQQNFAYKIDVDTIKLFEIKENADSTLSAFGDLRYKLIKQK